LVQSLACRLPSRSAPSGLSSYGPADLGSFMVRLLSTCLAVGQAFFTCPQGQLSGFFGMIWSVFFFISPWREGKRASAFSRVVKFSRRKIIFTRSCPLEADFLSQHARAIAAHTCSPPLLGVLIGSSFSPFFLLMTQAQGEVLLSV